MSLNIEQQILVEQRITNDAKSIVVAYLLLLFVGGLGAHRFYLGRTRSATAMLIFFVFGWVTLAFVVGLFFLIGVGIWGIVDLFLIPGMIKEEKDKLRQQLTSQAQLTPAQS